MKRNKYEALQSELESMLVKGEVGEDSHLLIAFLLFLQRRWDSAENYLLKVIRAKQSTRLQKMGALAILHYMKAGESGVTDKIICIL